jgi:hypothetical protein
MVAATKTAPRPPSREKQIRIKLINALGNPFRGAQVDFFADGTHLGSALNAFGEVLLNYSGPIKPTTVVVRFHDYVRELSVRQKVSTYVVRFPSARRAANPGIRSLQPEARCPDGTAGQPCVNCNIGGSIVRICA